LSLYRSVNIDSYKQYKTESVQAINYMYCFKTNIHSATTLFTFTITQDSRIELYPTTSDAARYTS